MTYPEYFVDKNGDNYNINMLANGFNDFFVNVQQQRFQNMEEMIKVKL